MSANSKSRIRTWAVLGALLVPAALAVAVGVQHDSRTVQFAPALVAATPTPNCPTSTPSDGNENSGYGDFGNEETGNCDVGNGNTTNNADGNANGAGADTPAANAQCTGSDEHSSSC